MLSKVFAADSTNFFLLLGTTLFLVVLGLVMVLSASSVVSYKADEGSFGGFIRQSIFAIIGIPLMLVVSRFSIGFWKAIAFPALIVGCVLQALVLWTPLGEEIGGNKNWIRIGTFSAQPSEAIKLALVIWLAVFLYRKQGQLDRFWPIMIPIVLVAGGSIVLVMLGHDLGTVMIMAGIVFGALFFAGVKLRYLAVPVVLGLIGFVILAATSENRMKRITSFLEFGDCTDLTNSCWQPQHGTWAMASGGIFGVGLGNSNAKWSWLPAADNDYIFAIIGEELGMIGALVVLVMFIVLAASFIRIINAATDPFVKVATAAVMVWLVGQAFVNIGVVLGVLPVLGVPLPLISAGGTALLTSLIAIGIVLSFARHQESTPLFPRRVRQD